MSKSFDFIQACKYMGKGIRVRVKDTKDKDNRWEKGVYAYMKGGIIYIHVGVREYKFCFNDDMDCDWELYEESNESKEHQEEEEILKKKIAIRSIGINKFSSSKNILSIKLTYYDHERNTCFLLSRQNLKTFIETLQEFVGE